MKICVTLCNFTSSIDYWTKRGGLAWKKNYVDSNLTSESKEIVSFTLLLNPVMTVIYLH